MAPKAISNGKAPNNAKRVTPPQSWLKYVESKIREAEESGRITHDDLKISVNARS